jgi:hypothetical protein
MQIMLSKHQQRNVWEGWLDSETRACYFAALCRRYHLTQRVVTWTILIVSSGAVAAVLTELPTDWSWVRPALAIVTAGLSLLSLVANFPKSATDCSDLQLQWHKLAIAYESLWADMSSQKAQDQLAELSQRAAELSQRAGPLLNKKRLMLKWKRETLAHHGFEAKA